MLLLVVDMLLLVFLSSVKLSLSAIGYIFLLNSFVLFIFLLIRYFKEKTKQPQTFQAERLLQKFTTLQQQTKIEQEKVNQKTQDFTDFITSWVHDVKIPLANLELMAQTTLDKKQLRNNIQEIDTKVSQALFYSRNENFYQDFHVRSLDVKELVDKVIRKYSPQLIQKRAEVDISGIQNQTMIGDSVWLTFVLEQLVTNALKYAGDGFVLRFDFYRKDNEDVLEVANTNSTVERMELPKLFDRGYTGKNVREKGKSTGMGLYLCQQILQKFGGRIFATTEDNEIRFHICLSQEERIY